MLRINSVIINFEIIILLRPEILPGTWQDWMYCMYPRSSYMTDFLPVSAPYYSLLHGPRKWAAMYSELEFLNIQ